MRENTGIIAYCGLLAVIIAITLIHEHEITYICQNNTGNEIQCTELSAYQADAEANSRQESSDQTAYLDYLQQRRMAEATDKMAFDYDIDIFVGIIGLGLLFYALYLNYISTDAAVAAASGNRAWITASASKSPRFNYTGDRLDIIFQWKNTGETPARNITTSGVNLIIPVDTDTEDIRPPSKSVFVKNAGAVFLSRGEVFDTTLVFNEETVREVINGTKHLAISLKAAYSTVHKGVSGETIYCWRVGTDDGGNNWHVVQIPHCSFIDQ